MVTSRAEATQIWSSTLTTSAQKNSDDLGRNGNVALNGEGNLRRMDIYPITFKATVYMIWLTLLGYIADVLLIN